MARYAIGGWLASGLYVLAVLLAVWLTGWHTLQPGSLDAREHLRSGRQTHPVMRLVIMQVILVAAWITKYDAVNQLTRHWLHLSAVAALGALFLAIGVLFAPIRGWRWLLIVVCAGALGSWIYLRPGVLATQLIVVLVVLATVGKAAQVPMWFAHSHARFSLISVPLWLFVMVDATVFDLLTQPTDTRVHDVLGPALDQTPPTSTGSGDEIVQAVLGSHQYFSLGVAAPIAGALFLTIMAVQAREYNRTMLLTIPFLGLWGGVSAGLVVATFTQGHYGLASPWIAAGVIAGVLVAARESQLWPLLMDAGQQWHHDETHRLL